jgi:sterol desaturase/sphingolipid hydroxylase (fatty acid hydroxylase superfamily)
VIFRRHTLEHHHFFTHQAMSFESTRDFKMVLFPPVLLLFFLGGIATPLGGLAFLLLTPNCGWLFVATAMSYFLCYEWLHFSYHLPDEHWLSRTRALARLRKHHTHHHDLALMGKWNFNITFPICDAVMGTRYKD